MLAYEEHAPPPHLAAFVRCFWTLRGEGDPSSVERILPDGSFELVFHRGDPFISDGSPQPRAMLVGQIRRPTLVASGRHADVSGIRFRLGGFGALTGLHAREMRDSVHDLRDVFDEDDAPGVIAILNRRASAIDARLSGAIRLLIRSNGSSRIRDIASAVGSSERTLERLFDCNVGLRPKELARVVRFQSALRGRDDGYYDDSHRAHEFLLLAGASPSVIFRERGELTDAFVGNLQDDVSPQR